MNIIEPTVEIYTEENYFRKIETIARVCSGTQGKVGSKPGFVENLCKNHHSTPFEHVRVKVQFDRFKTDRIKNNLPYGFSSRLNRSEQQSSYSINARDFLARGGTLDELQDLPEAKDYMTVKFTVDIGAAREMVRHRQFSFQERSTRYCNMAGGIDFVRPVPFEWAEEGTEEFGLLKSAWTSAESAYQQMILRGCRPQEARALLPLSTATVLYITGMHKQWEHLLKLRLAPGAHPQMRYIMEKLVELKDFPKDRIHVPEAGK